jgi:hypothetical protein
MNGLTPALERATKSSNGFSRQRSLWFFAFLFLSIAVICSLPRFGQRENENLPSVSDSDRYLEMARVFTGQQRQFTPEWASEHAHHYNRPLLPFAAGWLGKTLLFGNVRAAFSLINILSAAFGAFLLFIYLRRHCPEWTLAWLPSVLFLTGFPQLNWGYHILTDTIGYGTAIATAVYGDWLVARASEFRNPRYFLHLLGLFCASATAFLARETGWFAVIAITYVAYVHFPHSPSRRLKLGLILAVILLGKVPQTVYSAVFHVHGVPLKSSISSLMNLRYLLDFIVKTGVCFNFSWLLGLSGAWIWLRSHRPHPPLLVGWAIAALLYAGAGYYVNKIEIIGYPLRLSYAVFPILFFWVTGLFELRVPPPKRLTRALQFCVLQFLVNLLGVFLDPGRIGVSATDVFRSLKDLLI